MYDWIKGFKSKKGKDARINFEKIGDYISILQEKGLKAGAPFIKHPEGEIWELRPLRNRILFVAWNGEVFILLHQFLKKTQKTPKREIEKAKREYKDFLSRGALS